MLFRACRPARTVWPAVPLLAALTGCSQSAGLNALPSAQNHAATTPSARFRNVASESGLDYTWKVAGDRPLNILQTIGNGCAFLDYDRDGNLDVLLVGPKLALFHGDGHGHFENRSVAAGIDRFHGRFLGCAVGDFDGDGFDDVYVSGYETGLLLKNEQGRSFRDVTRDAGLKPEPWATSSAFVETVPGSGRLDLYVCNYVIFGPRTDPQLCNEHDVMTSCGPRHYQPRRGVLYLNDGHGHFRNSTRESGVANVSGKGLGVACADFDGSGKPGIALANDEMPGDLLQPAAGKAGSSAQYSNIADLAGTAYDRDGNVHGGMGIDWGDYDNDGKLDFFVATFQNEAKSLYHNDGEARFTDRSIPSGLGASTAPFVAFGCKFLDYDNDGWLDLIVANGHVQDNVQKIYKDTTYRQSAQLFRNSGGATIAFEDVSKPAGADLIQPIVGRGLATGDYDNDGRVDVLIVDSEGKPLLLHNESVGTGHWLGIRLVGTKSNRDGYGAVLTAVVGGRSLVRHCHSDGSYMSASDARVHFGLGKESSVASLTVRWPSGASMEYRNVPADRPITIQEGGAEIH